MIRELEGAVAKVSHMTLSEEDLTVTWALPVSKTDFAATGCKRSWGCTCIDPAKPGAICPYHAAKDHLHNIKLRIWNDAHGLDENMLPLFPDDEGNAVTAAAMVALVDELAQITGEPVVNADGLRRFGRHSWRSTGAVWLTGTMGIEVMKVQMMARWSSPVVTHYTRLAPLKAITSDFRKALAKKVGEKADAKNKVAMERSVRKLTAQLAIYQGNWKR